MCGPGPAGRGLALEWPDESADSWLARVNQSLAPQELERLRTSVNRGRPTPQWVARRLGLLFTLRDPGRPPKIATAARGEP